MDGILPLSADANGNTTFYLYGLGEIGEKADVWNYGLHDGTNTPRQLTDLLGEVTFAARYTPWGDTLETYGGGGFTFSYFGSVLDAVTGNVHHGGEKEVNKCELVLGRFLFHQLPLIITIGKEMLVLEAGLQTTGKTPKFSRRSLQIMP